MGDRPYTIGTFLNEFGVADFDKFVELRTYFDRRLQAALLESRFLTLGVARYTAASARTKIRNGFQPGSSRLDVLGTEE